MRGVAASVAVISTLGPDGPQAMVATSVTALSFDPPSLLVCINRSASLYPTLAGGAGFYVNILRGDHVALAMRCAGGAKGTDRFSSGAWRSDGDGVPYLSDAQAAARCSLAKHIDFGTHGVFIGVVSFAQSAETPDPLVYLDGRYCRIPAEGQRA